jgi:recombination protein RecR
MHLLVGKPEQLKALVSSLEEASRLVRRCARCGNLAEEELCPICADPRRDMRHICVVENVPDLMAFERSGSWRAGYHVLHGKLSPLHNVGPQDLNLQSLFSRIESGAVEEIVLALSNDVEGEATCHYIQEHLKAGPSVRISRIGFGIPSGGGVLYADPITLKSALDGRRTFT